MAVKDVQFNQHKVVLKQIQDQMRPTTIPVLASLGAVGVAVVELPELVAGIAIVAIALAILWSADLFFTKSKQTLGAIWVVGSSIVKGLDAIHTWIDGLFNWLEDAIAQATSDIASHIWNTGRNLFDYFAKPDQALISNLQTQVNNLNITLKAEAVRASQAEAALNKLLLDNVTALTKTITDNRSQEMNDVKDLGQQLSKLASTEQTDILHVRQDLVSESQYRASADATLQQEIDTISHELSTQIAGLQTELAGEETQISTNAAQTAAAIQTATGEIQTLQGTVAQEGATITQLEGTVAATQAPTATGVRTVSSVAEWTLAEIATLTELADDPCLCLASIGGMAGLSALVAGLEVGIL